MSEELAIEQLIDREVFVGGKLVGVIKGQRFSPRKEHVKSLRIDVVSDVAQEYMRKPAFTAPLAKELIHSLQPDVIYSNLKIYERIAAQVEKHYSN